MPYFVAVDIGCIECGEYSSVLGIFQNREKAQAVLDAAKAKQKENWTGQHSFELYTVENIQ